jgi:hypothetical protein
MSLEGNMLLAHLVSGRYGSPGIEEPYTGSAPARTVQAVFRLVVRIVGRRR